MHVRVHVHLLFPPPLPRYRANGGVSGVRWIWCTGQALVRVCGARLQPHTAHCAGRAGAASMLLEQSRLRGRGRTHRACGTRFVH